MGVQAIDQTMFPSVFGKTSCNKTYWSLSIPRGKYFDLLPALLLNNYIMYMTEPVNVKIGEYIP